MVSSHPGTAAGIALSLLVILSVLLAVPGGTAGAAPVGERATLTDGEPEPVSSPAIDDSARLSGIVTDEDGEGIFDAEIRIDGEVVATSGVDGHYQLELEEGTHEITVTAETYDTVTDNVTVTAGFQRHDVTLGPGPTVLEGTVTDENGTPIENATVDVVDTDHETDVDEEGQYAIEIDPGSYTLEASADGYETIRTNAMAEERHTTTEDVQLPLEPDDEPDDPDRDDDGTADESDGSVDETDPSESSSLSNRDQVLRVMVLAGLFVATMALAATAGLYRDRVQE